MDEHRIGLKPLLRRVWGGWAPIGQRPVASVQHRFRWRYLVSFVHPASGRTVWHLASEVSIPVFEVELRAFARAVGAGPKKQIVLVLDRAGWHTSLRLRVPHHVHHVQLLFLPAYSPELQPAEHLWPLTNDALLNTHCADLDPLDAAQFARGADLQRQPERIRSATLFPWWPKRLKRRQGPRWK
jgi:transposase